MSLSQKHETRKMLNVASSDQKSQLFTFFLFASWLRMEANSIEYELCLQERGTWWMFSNTKYWNYINPYLVWLHLSLVETPTWLNTCIPSLPICIKLVRQECWNKFLILVNWKLYPKTFSTCFMIGRSQHLNTSTSSHNNALLSAIYSHLKLEHSTKFSVKASNTSTSNRMQTTLSCNGNWTDRIPIFHQTSGTYHDYPQMCLASP